MQNADWTAVLIYFDKQGLGHLNLTVFRIGVRWLWGRITKSNFSYVVKVISSRHSQE